MTKYKVVKIDGTKHWDEKFRKDFHIKVIKSVYVFNPGEATHCCELTPSYELNFIHSQADYGDKLNEDMREEIDEKIMESDNMYAEPIAYMHCSSVDKMETIDIGEFDSIEDAIEYCQGNWV